MRAFLRQLRPALAALAVATVVCGVAYPLLTTAVGQVALGRQADGSLIETSGEIRGSSLLGQPFVGAGYFHPRPSAAGAGYDGAASGGSNLGPLSDDLAAAVAERVATYRSENGLSADVAVPVDAVTASASGLDPHISLANARLQIARVATARDLDPSVVDGLVDDHVDGRSLGVLGQPGVNVVELNLALDEVTEG